MMKYLISLFLFLSLNGLAQEPDNNCYGDYCVGQKNGLHGIMDVAGEQVIPFEYEGLSIIADLGLFAFKEAELWGVINSDNIRIIEPTFQAPQAVAARGEYLYIKPGNAKAGIYTKSGEQVFDDQYDQIFFANQSADYFVMQKGDNYKMVDAAGKEHYEGQIASVRSFGYKHRDRAVLVSLKNGSKIILDSSIFEASISAQFSKIEKPKGHNSVRVFTLAEKKNGNQLKQIAMNSGRYVSKPIYTDICFDPDCLTKFASAADIKRLKSQLFKAAGILPNGDIDLFRQSGFFKTFKKQQ